MSEIGGDGKGGAGGAGWGAEAKVARLIAWRQPKVGSTKGAVVKPDLSAILWIAAQVASKRMARRFPQARREVRRPHPQSGELGAYSL